MVILVLAHLKEMKSRILIEVTVPLYLDGELISEATSRIQSLNSILKTCNRGINMAFELFTRSGVFLTNIEKI